MINKLKKYAFALIVSTSLAPSQSLDAATRENNIEFATALLRGPAAYYEFKLRNDYSRSAYFKRAIIHTIRFLNDFSTLSKKSSCYSLAYDVFGYAISAACLGTMISLGKTTIIPENKQTTPPTCLGDDYTQFGLYVLPILETACALIRTQQVSPRGLYRSSELAKAPYSSMALAKGNVTTPQALLANIGLDLTRITQYFFTNIHAHEKTKDKNILMLFMLSAYLIAIYSEISDFHAIKKGVDDYIRERDESSEAIRRNMNILKAEVDKH